MVVSVLLFRSAEGAFPFSHRRALPVLLLEIDPPLRFKLAFASVMVTVAPAEDSSTALPLMVMVPLFWMPLAGTMWPLWILFTVPVVWLLKYPVTCKLLALVTLMVP